MIRNLVFDMGNVMIHYDPHHFIQRSGITDPAEAALLYREVFGSVEWTLMDWGRMDEPALEEKALPNLPESLRDTARGLIHRWNEPILPMEGMAALVKKCKEAGFKIYLLSNVSRRLHQYWTDIPGHEHFDGMVVSADLNQVKPLPCIFRHLLDRYQLKPEECLFIDDISLNVSGAMQLGMQGFLFRGDAEELEKHIFQQQQ